MPAWSDPKCTLWGRLEHLSKAITEGFVHDGSYSRHRRKHYGSSSKELPGRQFVVFIQNHDQIANASQGERLSKLVTVEQQKLAAAVLLCSPYVPLLFMGQEYGETAPFHFFTSFDDPALVEAVREGRRKEFAVFAGDRHFADPQDPATFEHSRLDWRRSQEAPHSALLRLYRDLIALRKNLPCLASCRKDLTRITFSQESKWMVLERSDPTPPLALLVATLLAVSNPFPWLLARESGS
jgi:maltooligosyltrehalose trehalohydrolase